MLETAVTFDGINGKFSRLPAAAGVRLMETPDAVASLTEAILGERAVLCMRAGDLTLDQTQAEILQFPKPANPSSLKLLDTIIDRIGELIESDKHFAQRFDPLVNELIDLRRDVAEIFTELKNGSQATVAVVKDAATAVHDAGAAVQDAAAAVREAAAAVKDAAVSSSADRPRVP